MAAWEIGWFTDGPPERLLQCADELLALAVEQGFFFWRAAGFITRGCSLAATGRPEEGIAQLTMGLADYRSTGAVTGVSWALTKLAGAYGMAGEPRLGLERISEALEHCGPGGERSYEAEAHRVRGELLAAAGDLASAEASFQDALAIARQQGAKLWELRAASSLAALWRDQGKCAAAYRLLARIHSWFIDGFDTGVLCKTKSLLDELRGVAGLGRKPQP